MSNLWVDGRDDLLQRMTGVSRAVKGNAAKGGPGSGFFNHEGRPGERGGSVDDGIENVESSGDGGSLSFAPRGGGEDVLALLTGEDTAQAEAPALVPYRPSDAVVERAAQWAHENMKGYNDLSLCVESFMDIVEERPLAIRIPEERLGDLLDSGRFMTQFETGDSVGCYDPDLRSRVEESAFGVPDDIDPALRPVYGYIDYETPPVDYYGNAEVVLKDSVKRRTSVTLGDSLTSANSPRFVGVLIDEMGNSERVLAAMGDNIRFMNEHRLARDYAGKKRLYTYLSYIEAQVHGGVTLADIDHIVIHSYDYVSEGETGSADYAKMLNDFGIPTTVTYKHK